MALESSARADAELLSALNPMVPKVEGAPLQWARLYGDSTALAVAQAARAHHGLTLVVTEDSRSAAQLQAVVEFFLPPNELDVLGFPDWETLPYDLFSPHQDIVSQRLETLYRLPRLRHGVLIIPATALMQRLLPRSYLEARSLMLAVGDTLDVTDMRRRLEQSGYRCVSQVMEHGEFAVRGALLDLFPMGAEHPYRIDLLDEDIESIRTFDPENQRSLSTVEQIRLLPAREFPTDEEAVRRFRQAWRSRFEGDPQQSSLYREVSNGHTPGGIEYYLPLFHEQTQSFTDYLPEHTLLIRSEGAAAALEQFEEELAERHEQRRHDVERPILTPAELYLPREELIDVWRRWPTVDVHGFELDPQQARPGTDHNFATSAPPRLPLQARAERPAGALQDFLRDFPGRTLLVTDSVGRRELVRDTLRDFGLTPHTCENWAAFVNGDHDFAITVGPLERGMLLEQPRLAVLSESLLFGERVSQARRRRRRGRESDQVIDSLTDLAPGAPVVHEEHGVGRYQGLQTLEVGGVSTEFLTLEYAGGDKLYVPVSSLHLIGRYTGASTESAPLHKLGGEQWRKIRRKAAEQARDVAAELLDIYARRAASKGHSHRLEDHEYRAFADAFPFEETPDQLNAIDAVVADLRRDGPMDRVVCGDVGFGKTEVALRAAFVAVQNSRQVAVLVPTTLLAQQHYQNFIDRFADWPIHVEVVSRFRGKRQQETILDSLRQGTIDILIGTHRLLQDDIRFKNLGLIIVDEEHRFGVRHKEKLKSLRAEVDVLTLTATPIPRTLNMSLAGLRDLSIIATPPVERVAIKTFVTEWNDALIREACQRELKRGGQIYVLHNEVQTIERMADTVRQLVPEAEVRVAHGQMRERDLEQVMLDFYHRRFNVLVCTTIIESGIDVPSANTIIINRADKLGLAQLHQLRGRVGRSHHRAYAYLVAPPRRALTADAVKRLEAIESLEDLGAGFMLATHDLEIRGAGELLGEGQSGQIQEIGFTLYSELLERAVKALREGRTPDLDKPLRHGPEIDVHLPALLPADYLPDVHSRLILYKRIASAADNEQLRDLQVEMIDRFGLLPEPAKHLMEVTRLKLRAQPLGVRKIDAGPRGGRIQFEAQPNIDAGRLIQLIQEQPQRYRLDGQETLRFQMDLEAAQTRLDTVAQLLDTLAPGTDAVTQENLREP